MMPFDLPAMRAMHWSQHMQPIEKQADESVEEIRRLEDAYKDDVKCESLHSSPENSYCTREVTHRMVACNGVVNVCYAHVSWALDEFELPRHCDGCTKPLADCWQIEPFG